MRKPNITTKKTFAISSEEPKDCAKGKVTKLGTKNTASHLASNAAPGLNKPYTPSPQDAFIAERIISEANNMPHPAREDGKDIPADRKYLRKATSIVTNNKVEATVCTGVDASDFVDVFVSTASLLGVTALIVSLLISLLPLKRVVLQFLWTPFVLCTGTPALQLRGP